ncbi:MAG: hypothetical protein Q8L51_03155 [Candidatus Amesbacteria bacterium]|nr:hypothetical protein [Candidatus Amesbacteria bacterium]
MKNDIVTKAILVFALWLALVYVWAMIGKWFGIWTELDRIYQSDKVTYFLLLIISRLEFSLLPTMNLALLIAIPVALASKTNIFSYETKVDLFNALIIAMAMVIICEIVIRVVTGLPPYIVVF